MLAGKSVGVSKQEAQLPTVNSTPRIHQRVTNLRRPRQK